MKQTHFFNQNVKNPYPILRQQNGKLAHTRCLFKRKKILILLQGIERSIRCDKKCKNPHLVSDHRTKDNHFWVKIVKIHALSPAHRRTKHIRILSKIIKLESIISFEGRKLTNFLIKLVNIHTPF